MKTVIEVHGLTKRYGSLVAVDNVSFEVAQGEIFGLLGPNGAGKTTSVECLEGLRRADGGTIRVLGLDPVSDERELRRRIGCQLQESALPDRMRVWEAVDLFSSFRPGRTGVARLLEQWGLAEKQRATFASLSGGQRQRLFVALALVTDPEVVFLDEMTAGLDPAARRVAWSLIEEIRARGTTIVLVTHFMDEAERLCDRVAILKNGRIEATGTPQGLINSIMPEMKLTFRTEARDLDWLRAVPHVTEMNRSGERVEIIGTDPVLALVSAALIEKGIVPSGLRVEQPTLEDAFLKLSDSAPTE